LPPERSGISDYSAEILPALSSHYEIEVIVNQDEVSDPWIKSNCPIRSVEWFRSHSQLYDRVLYHFGNSLFHRHMFQLIEEVPGLIVLHDFFLSGVLAHLDLYDMSNRWTEELFATGGYPLVVERHSGGDLSELKYDYPCNHSVLQSALGVIVHSEASLALARKWYGEDVTDWSVVPLARELADVDDKPGARRALGLEVDAFIVCSFGLLGPSKLNHRLLDAWLHSELYKDPNCVLIFVGQNDGTEYGRELLSLIRESGSKDRVRISGWVDQVEYRTYLAAADAAVQLRGLSRGETSASVLDCMNYGLPTIVNANGSLADLPKEAVCMLPDDFHTEQLVEALESLFGDRSLRTELAGRARATIEQSHSPHACALQYFKAIEGCYQDSAASLFSLVRKIADCGPAPGKAEDLLPFAEAIDRSISPGFSARQILVDVTDLMGAQGDEHDLVGLLRSLLTVKSSQCRVEPIAAAGDVGYRYARRFTLNLLGLPSDLLRDDPIDLHAGDAVLVLHIEKPVSPVCSSLCRRVARHGLELSFLVSESFLVRGAQAFPRVTLPVGLNELELYEPEDDDGFGSPLILKTISQWLNEHPKFRLATSRTYWQHDATLN
jgi:glycosyltransferase involved in cell wall biosynthesis